MLFGFPGFSPALHEISGRIVLPNFSCCNIKIFSAHYLSVVTNNNHWESLEIFTQLNSANKQNNTFAFDGQCHTQICNQYICHFLCSAHYKVYKEDFKRMRLGLLGCLGCLGRLGRLGCLGCLGLLWVPWVAWPAVT